MTTAQNNELKPVAGLLEYPVLATGAADINAGDNVYYDDADKGVKPLDSDAHAATYAGVASDSSFVNLYGTKKYVVTLPVAVKGIRKFKSVDGQTYAHGVYVYFSTDAQTVTSTDPGSGHPIGRVWLQNGQAAIAGDGVKEVPVLIIPQFPVAGGL